MVQVKTLRHSYCVGLRPNHTYGSRRVPHLREVKTNWFLFKEESELWTNKNSFFLSEEKLRAYKHEDSGEFVRGIQHLRAVTWKALLFTAGSEKRRWEQGLEFLAIITFYKIKI